MCISRGEAETQSSARQIKYGLTKLKIESPNTTKICKENFRMLDLCVYCLHISQTSLLGRVLSSPDLHMRQQ